MSLEAKVANESNNSGGGGGGASPAEKSSVTQQAFEAMRAKAAAGNQ